MYWTPDPIAFADDDEATRLFGFYNAMVSVIVPTYNERDNVPALLEALDSELRDGGYEYEVVIVDDDSPDGTGRVAEEYADEYPVHVVHRKNERGRASAVLRGIHEATYDVVVGFDADLQIPVKKIPDLIAAIENGADIVVAGKYTGSQNPESFGLVQRILSKGENVVAKTLLSELRQLNDVSDFFAMRREVIDGVDIRIVGGNKLIVNILVQGKYNTVVETDYRIGVRNEGESKLGLGATVDTLLHLLKLWYHEKVQG